MEHSPSNFKNVPGLECKRCGHKDTHYVYKRGPHDRCDCGKCKAYIKFVGYNEVEWISGVTQPGKKDENAPYGQIRFGKYNGYEAEEIEDIGYMVWAVNGRKMEKRLHKVFEERLRTFGYEKHLEAANKDTGPS